jgi:hypothetical protein
VAHILRATGAELRGRRGPYGVVVDNVNVSVLL